MNAKEVKACLQTRHQVPEWCWAEEFSLEPGYYGEGRRIDALAFNNYPSRGHKIVSYEVKISRADFLAELKEPEKRKSAVALVDEFYFACPKGLVKASEIPEECGLIECDVTESGLYSRLRVKSKNWVQWDTYPNKVKITRLLPKWFMASVIRQFDPARINLGHRSDAFRYRVEAEKLRASMRDAKREVHREFSKYCYKHGVSSYSAVKDSFCV